MHASPDTPELRDPAPELGPLDFATRFTLIAAGLVALIARAFLRHPGLAPLILPLCRRLNRNARRIAALMARLAAGRRPRRHRPGKSGGRTAKPPIPTTRAWLVSILGHDAAAYGSQLAHLLAEPGVSDLLAASPAVTRLLRPLCRTLGLPLGDRCASSRTESPPAALCAVGRDSCASSRTESPATPLPALVLRATGAFPFKNPESPDTPPFGVAPPATGVFPFKNPESPAATLRPPPCPHVRWPWFPRSHAKPA